MLKSDDISQSPSRKFEKQKSSLYHILSFETFNTHYLTPSKTVEIIQLNSKNKYVYLYNQEGCYFRLFCEVKALIEFLRLGKETKHILFYSEEELDRYLEMEFD